MFRFFLRIYLGVLASVLVAAGLIIAIMIRNIEVDGIRFLEQIGQVPMTLVTEPLENAGPGEEQALLQSLQNKLGIPLRLETEAALGTELSPFDLKRLRQHQVVASSNLRPPRFFRMLPDGRLVVLGPFAPIRPLFGMRAFWSFLIVLTCLMLAVPMLLRPLRRQLESLTTGADAFGNGDWSVRIPVKPGEATSQLALAFNDMAARLQQLWQGQQYLMGAVAHDLRTPLCRLRYAVELLEVVDDRTERSTMLAEIDQDFEELHALIEHLLTYTRLKHEPPPQDWELRDVFEELTSAVEKLPPGRSDVQISCVEPATRVMAPLIRADLRRVLTNLLTNAARHARSRVELTLTQKSLQTLEIRVNDDGPGIPEAEQERVFEPFVRLTETRERRGAGVGLGLAIVAQLVARMGGSIRVTASEWGGAAFILTLPIRKEARPVQSSMLSS